VTIQKKSGVRKTTVCGERVRDKLLVEEYKSCRDLIGKNIDIIEKTEVYALGAIACIFVFSLSSTERIVSVAAAWLPMVISFLGLVRFIGLDNTIDKINLYLISVEQKYGSINWTTFHKAANTKKVLKKTRYCFWITLPIVSFPFGLYMTCNAPLSTKTPASGVSTQGTPNMSHVQNKNSN
jgi:hypothetical protein